MVAVQGLQARTPDLRGTQKHNDVVWPYSASPCGLHDTLSLSSVPEQVLKFREVGQAIDY